MKSGFKKLAEAEKKKGFFVCWSGTTEDLVKLAKWFKKLLKKWRRKNVVGKN